MKNYQTPDLYFEKQIETVRRQKALEKVRIDVTAMLGFAIRGPIGRPVRVTSWRSFEAIYGGFSSDYFLPQAVFSFFANGGRELLVLRVARTEGEGAAAPSSLVLRDLYGRPTLRVTAKDPGRWGDQVSVKVLAASRPARTRVLGDIARGATEARVELTKGFAPGTVVRITEGARSEYARLTAVERKKLVWDRKERVRGDYSADQVTIEAVEMQLVVSSPYGLEIHDNLVFAADHPRSLVKVINERSGTVVLEDLGSKTPAPFNLPQADLEENLVGGSDGSHGVSVANYVGWDRGLGERWGLCSLEDFDEVGIICLPDLQTSVDRGDFSDSDFEAAQQAVVDFCERRRTAVAFLDSPRGLTVEAVRDWRERFDTKYSALFYPWLRVQDQVNGGGATRLVPPCGHMAGLTGNVDHEVGVHRAAANLVLKDVIGLERDLNKDQTDLLAPEGVNCMRVFRGRGIRPWGARTLSSDPQWAHLSVRRLFVMVERSIAEGTEWAVFENNDWGLWKAVERQISSFLYKIWREGMLVGGVPEEAFFVRCDEELNPQEIRDAGEFHCEIGLAAVRPAEFLVFRIGQQAKDIITEEPVS